jgi:hypothetical protein
MKLTLDQKIEILHDSCRECEIDGHVVASENKSELYTVAEQAMGRFDWYKNMPHKNSYLYMDSVDACFYISKSNYACVAFTAKWCVGSKDLSIAKFEKAITIINKMLETMQSKINEVLGKEVTNE